MPVKFDPKIHHRKSIRLSGYDYTQAGAYFVTIVTWRRECLFGEVVNGEVALNDFGKIADTCWCAIPEHFRNVDLGVHVIMPNHVHGIMMIREAELHNNIGARSDAGAQQCCAPTPIDGHKINVKPGSLGAIVRSFKSAVSYRINKEHNTTGIWQRNYGACPEFMEGNTSSATNTKWRISGVISRRIRSIGARMKRILIMRRS